MKLNKKLLYLILIYFFILKTKNYFKLFFYSFQFVQHYKTLSRHKLKKDDSKYLPVNEWKHVSYFIEPMTCPIQTPNFDTLYSNTILDISKGYVKLKIPKYIFNSHNLEKKYYSLQFIDISGNNIGFLSLRNNIQDNTSFYIINTHNYEKSVKHIGSDPKNKMVFDCWFVYVILRIQVDFTDSVDFTNSVLYQNSFDISYFYVQNLDIQISYFLKYDVNQNVHVSDINSREFYQIFKHSYKYHKYNIYDKLYYDFNEYSYYLKFITFISKKLIRYLINRDYKGWVYKKRFSNIKKYIDDNIFKTMVSWKYLYAIDEAEALYYMNRYDSVGEKLTGENIYVIHCQTEFYFCNCFWSISCYDYESGQFLKNENGIYSRGNNINQKISIILTSKKLDDSYLKYIKYKIPEKTNIEDYTLYTPLNLYYLVLRIYYPKDNIELYSLPQIENILIK